MTPGPWCIQRMAPRTRGSLEAGTAPVLEPREAPEYGRHPTRAKAVRALMVALEPDLAKAPYDFVAKHYAQHVRNLGHFRVRRVPVPESMGSTLGRENPRRWRQEDAREASPRAALALVEAVPPPPEATCADCGRRAPAKRAMGADWCVDCFPAYVDDANA